MSSGIAAWIAHVGFWVLLPYGWAWGELNVKWVIGLLLLWLAGFFGLPYLPYGAAMFSSYVAVLDIALVFRVFKGDVRLT